MLRGAGPEEMDATAEGVAAAGAIPPLMHVVSTGQRSALLRAAADALTLMSYDSTQRAAAIEEAAGVVPLARLMRSNDLGCQAAAFGSSQTSPAAASTTSAMCTGQPFWRRAASL